MNVSPLVDPNTFSITYKQTNKYESLPDVKGMVYEDIESLKHMGFQLSRVYECYTALSYAISNGYTIVLGFTSNTISCGLRQIIKELCRCKLVHCIVTTAGGIEEDLIKTVVPFKYAHHKVSDDIYYNDGYNRTENILCPNEGYVWFEKYLKNLGSTNPSFYFTDSIKLCETLSKNISSETSYLHWAYKNKILVIPLGIEDGAIGDHFAVEHYQKLSRGEPLPVLNCSLNLPTYMNFVHNHQKICAVILGGGAPKHFIMNGLIFKGGSDMTLYFNNGSCVDGSNASASVEESVSWGKSNKEGLMLKAVGDFCFTFYLVASQLIKDHLSKFK